MRKNSSAAKQPAFWRRFSLLPLLSLLGGCNTVVLFPAGDIAAQQRDLLVVSTLLMLLIIVPVMVFTIVFAYHYRETNTTARYEPFWHHSTKLEVLIWSAPLTIIICLGAITWSGSHMLDPFRPTTRLARDEPISPKTRPLVVDVVAMNWKWLFIYPQYGVASVNELALPVNRPVEFHITSDTVMNSFYIPALAGQIYAMSGMEGQLHAVLNRAGEYQGMSANYSGAGFSGMHFAVLGQSLQGFTSWIAASKKASGKLDRAAYLALAEPSEYVKPRQYGAVEPDIFHAAVNRCVESGRMCLDQMMRIDAQGGSTSLASLHDIVPRTIVEGSPAFGGAPAYVAAEECIVFKPIPARSVAKAATSGFHDLVWIAALDEFGTRLTR